MWSNDYFSSYRSYQHTVSYGIFFYFIYVLVYTILQVAVCISLSQNERIIYCLIYKYFHNYFQNSY